jgi:hypothetical protein
MTMKVNLTECIERRRAFYAGKMKRGILFTVENFKQAKKPREATVAAGLEKGGEKSEWPGPKRLLDFNRELCSADRDVADDSLPILSPLSFFGHAQIIEGMGYPVRRMVVAGDRGSSVTERIENFEDLFSLKWDESSPIMKLSAEYIETARHDYADAFLLSPMMFNDALHQLTQLRSYDMAYMDLYDHPEEVHRWFTMINETVMRHHEFQLERMGSFAGGWISVRVGWCAPKPVEINLDDYLACSNEIYQEFGLPYHQKIIDRFGAGLIHYHTPDPRLLHDVVKLKNIVALQIGGDPKLPPPIDCMDELREIAGDIPFVWMRIERDRFEKMLKEKSLPGNTEYYVAGVHDIADANRLADLAKNYESNR